MDDRILDITVSKVVINLLKEMMINDVFTNGVLEYGGNSIVIPNTTENIAFLLKNGLIEDEVSESYDMVRLIAVDIK